MAKVKVWKRTDGGVSITRFDFTKKLADETDEAFIERCSVKLRPCFVGAEELIVDEKDIPTSRENRNEWHFKDGKVQVDLQKVQAKQTKAQSKQNVLNKLGISAQELKDLLG